MFARYGVTLKDGGSGHKNTLQLWGSKTKCTFGGECYVGGARLVGSYKVGKGHSAPRSSKNEMCAAENGFNERDNRRMVTWVWQGRWEI